MGGMGGGAEEGWSEQGSRHSVYHYYYIQVSDLSVSWISWEQRACIGLGNYIVGNK